MALHTKEISIPTPYKHLTKGYTIGHTTTRRLFRVVGWILGLPVDAIFAMFTKGEYLDFWKTPHVRCVDGTNVSGIISAGLSRICDLIGAVVGGTLGLLITVPIYFLDFVASTLSYGYSYLADKLNKIASIIPKTAVFQNITVNEPKNIFKTVFNLSTATLGISIASIPWVIAKIIECAIPTEKISHFVLEKFSILGGMIGTIALTPYIVIKVCFLDTPQKIHQKIRSGIGKIVSLIYAATNTKINPDAHSPEFKNRVRNYKKLDRVAERIFGQQGHSSSEIKGTLCAISRVRIQDQPLSKLACCPNGHFFHKDHITKWVKENNTCPLNPKFRLKISDLKSGEPLLEHLAGICYRNN